MNQEDTITLPLSIKEEDVERFFSNKGNSVRQIEILLENLDTQFEDFVFQDLKERVKETDLADEEIFKNLKFMKKTFKEITEIAIMYKTLINFVSMGIQITDENIQKIISKDYIMYIMKSYREVLIALIEEYKNSKKSLEEIQYNLYHIKNGNLIN